MGLIANVEKKKKAVRKLEKKEIPKVDSNVKQASLDKFKKREDEILKKVEERVKLPKVESKEKSEVSPKVEELKKKDEAKLKDVEEKVADVVEAVKENGNKVKKKVKKAEGGSLFADIKKEVMSKLTYSDTPKPIKKEAFSLADIKKSVQAELAGGSSRNKVEAEDRVQTGIPGLDSLMAGGFLKKSMVLVGGGAGSGKTIFSMQFLVNGINENDETGIYITFEQEESQILRDFKSFNWELQEKIDKGKLVILTYTPEQVERFLESGGGIVRDIIDKIGARRIVIDSLTAFVLLYPTEIEKRRAVFKLYRTMEKWGCTTMMISEQEPDPKRHKSTVVEFQADAVLLLYNQRTGDVRERSMEIFKMRASEHAQKIFPMKIDRVGITIYPEATVF